MMSVIEKKNLQIHLIYKKLIKYFRRLILFIIINLFLYKLLYLFLLLLLIFNINKAK